MNSLGLMSIYLKVTSSHYAGVSQPVIEYSINGDRQEIIISSFKV